jgi:hypothetical protein
VIGPSAKCVKVARRRHTVLAVEDPELQAARAGVDDEDAHGMR